MDRRAALQALGVSLAASFAPCLSRAQQSSPVVAVPLIAAGPDDPLIVALRTGLAEHGYVDGKNIQILHRSTGGKVEGLPFLLRELVQLKVDVIVAGAAPIVAAAKEATKTIPIIMVGWDYDPVAAGFVESLSRPGGNITGVYLSSEETIGKRLELTTELLPGVSNVAVLYDDFGKRQYRHIESAAKATKLRVQPIEVAGLPDFEPALKRAKGKKAAAAIVAFSPYFYVNRKAFANAALAQRLPTIFELSSMVQAGGLMSYGPETSYGWRRAGYFVSRILAGVRPSDLPVEQPREYRLVVNMKTAKALGIIVPERILSLADEVIKT